MTTETLHVGVQSGKDGEATRQTRGRESVSVRDLDGDATLPAPTAPREALQRPTESGSPLPRSARPLQLYVFSGRDR